MQDLRPYQHLAVDHILATKRCAVWVFMGGGKTVSTLTALVLLDLLEGDAFPVLVIAPLRVASSTWPAEVEKWAHLSHLTVSTILGGEAERRAAARAKAHLYTVNYENLPWLIEELGADWPFATVVVDESTKLKGFRGSIQRSKTGKAFVRSGGGKRTSALAKVAHSKVKRFIQLTGTPAPLGLVDLWAQAWFLDGGRRLGHSFGAFTDRYFRTIPNPAGYSQIEPLPFAQEQIQDKLRDVCLTLDPRDWFNLREPIHTVVYVDLPKKVGALYRDMEREFFMSVDGHEVEAFNAASKSMKLRQLTSGAVYVEQDLGGDSAPWKEVHDVKIQALGSIIEEAGGMPVLVAYQFRSDLARLLKAFPQGRHLDDNPKTITEWNTGNIPILFAHPKSAGHGLNLQDGGNILVFFSHDWNLEERLQVIERIGPVRQLQAGYDRPVYIYDIVARKTVDELVLKRHETKAEVQQILLDAMKERQTCNSN